MVGGSEGRVDGSEGRVGGSEEWWVAEKERKVTEWKYGEGRGM